MSAILITKERRSGRWTWTCRRPECDGAAGAGLHTVHLAMQEADRHAAEKHPQHDPSATLGA